MRICSVTNVLGSGRNRPIRTSDYRLWGSPRTRGRALALCRMFNQAIRGQAPPKYVSSDHDPLYRFHQWQANLHVLEVTEIKTVPFVPLSHPFVERLIGTVRREYLDQMIFWTRADLEEKLLSFPTLLQPRFIMHTSLWH